MKAIHKAKDGWRWRLVAANGKIIAESGEAYTREADAERGFETVRAAFAALEVGPSPTTYSE